MFCPQSACYSNIPSGCGYRMWLPAVQVPLFLSVFQDWNVYLTSWRRDNSAGPFWTSHKQKELTISGVSFIYPFQSVTGGFCPCSLIQYHWQLTPSHPVVVDLHRVKPIQGWLWLGFNHRPTVRPRISGFVSTDAHSVSQRRFRQLELFRVPFFQATMRTCRT